MSDLARPHLDIRRRVRRSARPCGSSAGPWPTILRRPPPKLPADRRWAPRHTIREASRTGPQPGTPDPTPHRHARKRVGRTTIVDRRAFLIVSARAGLAASAGALGLA